MIFNELILTLFAEIVAEISTAIMKQRNNDLKKTQKAVTELVNSNSKN